MATLSEVPSRLTWSILCLARITRPHAWHPLTYCSVVSASDKLGKRPIAPLTNSPSNANLVFGALGAGLTSLVVVMLFWTGFAPFGDGGMATATRAKSWFDYNLFLSVVLASYIPFEWVKKKYVMSPSEVVVTSGQ